jgi:prepilin-type N-terminal cleavage/methylation domain-containing protein
MRYKYQFKLVILIINMKLSPLLPNSIKSNQSGFTIIESLMAIVVVGILLAGISPVIILSTATRVQARRVELATQAAKAFVDGIRAGTLPDPIIDSGLKLDAATSTNTRTIDANSNKYLLSANAPTSSNSLYCFNKDSKINLPNCTSNSFYIQAIRLAVDPSKPDEGEGYRLGIRVYRSDAFEGSGSLKRTADDGGKGKAQSTFTGGLGDRKAPLLEMTTEIVRGQPSYNAMCARLGGCQQ